MNKVFDKSTTKYSHKRNIFLAIAGLAVGFLNGFFGGGGGMLVVPALTLFGKLDEKTAHATAIAVILPLSIASGIIYFINGQINLLKLACVSGGVFFGGLVGGFLLKKLSNKFLGLLFYALMIAAGLSVIFR